MGAVHAKDITPADSMMKEEKRKSQDILLEEVPCRVQRVHIDGLKRTKNDMVTGHVKDLFKSENFEDMVKRAHLAKINIERLGLFKNVGIFIDTSKGEDSRPDGYEITFNVQETRRIVGGISTLVGTNEGSMLFGMRLPNMFGRGERFNVEYTYGTKNASGFNVALIKPLSGNPDYLLTLGSHKFQADYPWSGYKEANKGVSLDFSFPTILGAHTLKWEGIWRDIQCMSGATSFSVREQAGHSLKSSLKHTIVRDHRDDPIIPNEGSIVSLTTEVAGLGGRLGGDVDFIKQEAEIQAFKSLFLGSVLHVSMAGGLMKSLSPTREIKINDKFMIGGPLTLRGFNMKGCGPHDNGNALGAEAYVQGGVHLYTPLPFTPARGAFSQLFRTHFFINAGNLTNIDLSADQKESLSQLIETMRVSYGAGVVIRMGRVARMELNYCVPLRTQRDDSINPGIQFGIGVSFL